MYQRLIRNALFEFYNLVYRERAPDGLILVFTSCASSLRYCISILEKIVHHFSLRLPRPHMDQLGPKNWPETSIKSAHLCV